MSGFFLDLVITSVRIVANAPAITAIMIPMVIRLPIEIGTALEGDVDVGSATVEDGG
jgi:hypothetical protein